MSDDDRASDPAEWLRYAAEDLEAAESNMEGLRPRHRCFFAQQAVEKAIKAVLVFENISFPKWHDADALRDLVPQGWPFVAEFPLLGSLTVWAVASRYADTSLLPTEEHAAETVALARRLYDAVERDLRTRGLSI